MLDGIARLSPRAKASVARRRYDEYRRVGDFFYNVEEAQRSAKICRLRSDEPTGDLHDYTRALLQCSGSITGHTLRGNRREPLLVYSCSLRSGSEPGFELRIST